MSKVKELKVVCPRYIDIPRVTKKDKRWHINLNIYRNSHSRESNDVKKIFLEQMTEQLKGIELETPVRVEVTVYSGTKTIIDKDNVAAITKKFLFDAMTKLGVWPDDNDTYVKDEHTYPTVYDKDNGRVEVYFKTIEENNDE